LAEISSDKNNLTKFTGYRKGNGLSGINRFLSTFLEGFHVYEK